MGIYKLFTGFLVVCYQIINSLEHGDKENKMFIGEGASGRHYICETEIVEL
jgi:hypothetical protein